MWFEAKETGTFEISCAQHCGTNHYKMRGTLTILPEAEYAAWAAEASAISARNWDPDDKTAHWGWDWERNK
jgi:cytochrome c oxidase subunit 2